MNNTSKRELPPKESGIFKNILKHYEHKQYKKGIKLADQILKKFPEHGETLAMKGLFLNNMDKKEDAYEHVKRGLKFDLTSHICWHVYGLLYRSDKNYEKAAHCYTHALKHNKNDIQILKDFALLQIQMRNYGALNETRHQLLQLKPNNPPFWIGLSMSYHLLGRFDMATSVLQAYEDTLKETPAVLTPNFELSELLMYHNMLLEESGDLQAALDQLVAVKPKVCDRRAWKEKRAYYLLKLGRLEEAEKAYRGLINENPDSYSYFEALENVRGLSAENLTEEEQNALISIYSELAVRYPRSNAVKRLPLNRITGERFRAQADSYFRGALRKGVPSLFVNVKRLYRDGEKQKIIFELVDGYRRSLKEQGTFGGEEETSKEPPTAYLWTLYFLAQHHDQRRETARALELINEAIDHTPTLVELHMTRGRILKASTTHGGDLAAAAQAMNEARELDLQDRFINSKCTKYYLRNNQIAEAEKIIGLFTRNDAPDPIQDLTDMQCMWFSLEEGNAHLRLNQLGRSLKRFHAIDKHFTDITDDQFDFHMYCLRKTTLRAYMGMLRLEDQLRSHPYYVKAVQGAVEAYLYLFDMPQGVDEDGELAGLSEAEKKKAKNKARKAGLKQKEAEAKKAPAEEKTAEKTPVKKQVLPSKPVDEDPDGEKLVKTQDPLAEALRFIKPLQELAPDRIETHLLGFEIYLRQQKYLLALRALIQASKIDNHNPAINKNAVRFHLAVDNNQNLHPIVQKVITAELPRVLAEGTTVEQFNKQTLESHPGSVPHLVTVAETIYLADPSKKDVAEAMLLDDIAKDEFAATRTLQSSVDALNILQKTLKSTRIEEYKAKAIAWFPTAADFK